MEQILDDAGFPVYVLCKDSDEIIAFPSYLTMRSYLEAVDVENDEYKAFDVSGFVLKLGVGEPKTTWLKIERSQNQLPATEFADMKVRAQTFKDAEPFLRVLARKLGLARAKG
jgi:hypothetical protein